MLYRKIQCFHAKSSSPVTALYFQIINRCYIIIDGHMHTSDFLSVTECFDPFSVLCFRNLHIQYVLYFWLNPHIVGHEIFRRFQLCSQSAQCLTSSQAIWLIDKINLTYAIILNLFLCHFI